jgi:hypothetical protein
MKRISVFSLSLTLAAATVFFSGCKGKVTDDQLAANVQSKIGSDPALQGQPISVAVKDGVVTLTGTSNGQGSRELAARDASNVDGVKSVVNDIAMPGQPAPTPEAGNMAPVPPPPPPPSARKASTVPPARSSAPAAAPPPAPAAPQPIVIPAGTRIQVRLGQTISSKTAQAGDPFSGTLVSAVRVNEETIIRAGAQASGVVTEARNQGKIKGAGVLALRLDSLRADGRTYQVRTSQLERVEKGKGKRTAVTTGGGAALGALIGGLAGGGKGAGIGALVGGGAGLTGGALTGNHEIVLPAESILTFTLTQSVTIQR